MKILVIGGGNMGQTYAKSFLHAHIVNKEQLIILEKSEEKAVLLNQLNIGSVQGAPGPYIKDADLIILAVKPQDLSTLLPSIRQYIDSQQLVLSIMAGITIDSIQEQLGILKVIRAMPNLPAQIGIGMTVFTSSKEVTRIELVTVQNLLNATGKTIYVEAEQAIDASTAISGSGPAYVFYFMQSMINAALERGFNQSQAELLTYQTFQGAVDLFKKYEFSCEDWIKKVASRGGTTEAALKSFSANDVTGNIQEGISAAHIRAQELSKL